MRFATGTGVEKGVPMLDIVLAAMAVLTPQASPKWQVIDINEEHKRVVTVDVAARPATPKSDGIVKARVFITVDMPKISALLGYWWIDCGRKLHRVTDTAAFDKSGKLGKPDSQGPEWEPTTPGSLFSAVEDYVCRGETDRPGFHLFGDAPIEEANALLKPGW